MNQRHSFDTFFIPNTIKTNMQACIPKYMAKSLVISGTRYKWGGGSLIERRFNRGGLIRAFTVDSNNRKKYECLGFSH